MYSCLSFFALTGQERAEYERLILQQRDQYTIWNNSTVNERSASGCRDAGCNSSEDGRVTGKGMERCCKPTTYSGQSEMEGYDGSETIPAVVAVGAADVTVRWVPVACLS